MNINNEKVLKNFHMYDNVKVDTTIGDIKYGYISQINLNALGEIVFEVTIPECDNENFQAYHTKTNFHPARLSKIC